MNVEVEMVRLSNAVVHPWTVMVVSFDTAITDVTVAAPRHADHFTEWTKTFSIECFKQVSELY